MQARGVRLLATLLVGAVLGGCTTTSAGDPGPAPTGQSETESIPSSSTDEPETLPSDGAPKVTSPLEASSIEQDPCQALTQAQAKELNVTYPGKPFKGNFGNACEWLGPNNNGGNATIDFLSDEPRGMSAVYRSKNNGEFAFFEELEPVAGHPMAAYGTSDSREKGGTCSVAVGLTDELVFIVFLGLSRANIGHKDPCATASQVGEMMLTTMGAQ
jgi:hypothetical protein